MVLDRVAQRTVLDNVRAQLRLTRKDLVADVRSHGDLPLGEYLRDADRELAEVYRSHSWTALRREAGLPTAPAGPDEQPLLKRLAAFTHVDDPERASVYAQLADPAGPRYDRADRSRAALRPDAVLPVLADARRVRLLRRRPRPPARAIPPCARSCAS